MNTIISQLLAIPTKKVSAPRRSGGNTGRPEFKEGSRTSLLLAAMGDGAVWSVSNVSTKFGLTRNQASWVMRNLAKRGKIIKVGEEARRNNSAFLYRKTTTQGIK